MPLIMDHHYPPMKFLILLKSRAKEGDTRIDGLRVAECQSNSEPKKKKEDTSSLSHPLSHLQQLWSPMVEVLYYTLYTNNTLY